MTRDEEIEQLRATIADRDARWFALVESSAQIVWAADARGRGIQDPQLQKVSHLTWDAFTGQIFAAQQSGAWIECVHLEDRELLTQAWSSALISGKAFRAEYRLRHVSGEWRWVLARGTAIRDSKDVITGWLGTCTDITHRRQTEEALRESQQRLVAALDAGQMGTWIWRLSDNTSWWDEASVKLWGRLANEVDNHDTVALLNYVYEEDLPAVKRAMMDVLRTRGSTSVEFRAKRPDGALQWICARGRVDRDTTDSPVQVVGAFIDITKLKATEESLRQAQKMQALGTLAGGIAHDFNNLLLAIRGNVQLALDTCCFNPAGQDALQEIVKASERATDLVRRILTFSSQQLREQGATKLLPAIQDALQLLRASIPRHIEIRTRLNDAPLTVTLSATELQQIVLNLVTNASHAIGEQAGGVDVHVDVRKPGNELLAKHPELIDKPLVCLTVCDTGCGMDSVTRGRIFDPFFTTKPIGKGTGLGLAVVHGIVQGCGGAIEVESELNAGSTFRVWLPLIAAAQENLAPPKSTVHSAHGERILYVDDDEAIVFLITRTLQNAGYQVAGHVSPQLALQAFSDNPVEFDVVVTDLSMPEMNGFEFAHAIKQVRSSTPVVLTSGYVRPQDQTRAIELGIEHIILKPNTVEELGQVLDQLCQQLHKRKPL